jgi:hypothetical protein
VSPLTIVATASTGSEGSFPSPTNTVGQTLLSPRVSTRTAWATIAMPTMKNGRP